MVKIKDHAPLIFTFEKFEKCFWEEFNFIKGKNDFSKYKYLYRHLS